MIGFLPGLYEDELFYSWVARYYCHSGYDAYVNAIEDWFTKRNVRPDKEYITALNDDAMNVISKTITTEALIRNHTMFPLSRFANPERLRNAFGKMLLQKGNIHDLLPVPAGKQKRVMRFCPVCAMEDRKKYGEAYWHRSPQIPGIDICVRHRCRLIDTEIMMKGRQNPRLYIAEIEIGNEDAESVNNDKELALASYMTEMFFQPIEMENNVPTSAFLTSNLEGTKYSTIRGQRKFVGMLFEDMMQFYRDYKIEGITELFNLKKCLSGYRFNYVEFCQIGYFLGIPTEELANPVLPAISQEERFDRQVRDMLKKGINVERISKALGVSRHTVLSVFRKPEPGEHNYGNRAGTTKEDWNKMDSEFQLRVREICEKIYRGDNGKPGRVTQNTVERLLGMPQRRLNNLKQCREIILEYQESIDEFRARKVVWCYRNLMKESCLPISKTTLYKALNMKNKEMQACLPYMKKYCGRDEEKEIKKIIMIIQE